MIESLPENKVKQIRDLRARGFTQRQIAEIVGVGKSTVGVVMRRTGGNVTDIGRKRSARVEITDEMIEGMACWLAGQTKVTDAHRQAATEALRIALTWKPKQIAA